MVRNRLLEKIEADLAHFHHSHPHVSSSEGGEAAK
jgi:glycerol-3-phosphate acyltransferase PlsX